LGCARQGAPGDLVWFGRIWYHGVASDCLASCGDHRRPHEYSQDAVQRIRRAASKSANGWNPLLCWLSCLRRPHRGHNCGLAWIRKRNHIIFAKYILQPTPLQPEACITLSANPKVSLLGIATGVSGPLYPSSVGLFVLPVVTACQLGACPHRACRAVDGEHVPIVALDNPVNANLEAFALRSLVEDHLRLRC